MFASSFFQVLSKGPRRVWKDVMDNKCNQRFCKLFMMKKSVLFFAAAILLGFGLQSFDREENNGVDNNQGANDGNTTSVQWVDLGLPSGLLWADRNLGAQSPEDYGNYYAWGETSPKEVYDWITYAYGNDYNALTKYCNQSDYGLNGFKDKLTTLKASDDAAKAELGGKARMPRDSEWHELIYETKSTWTTRNGVYGRLFTGSNGKSIFLPAAGDRYRSRPSSNAGESGHYWSSTLNINGPYGARCFYFGLSTQDRFNGSRQYGYTVRAVRTK